MSATKLASRYAKAILEDSISSNTLDITKDDLNLIKSACDGSNDLQALLKSPLIKSDVKENIFKQIFQSKVSNQVLNFVLLVISHKRESFLNQIIGEFFNQYNELKEISEITITTAVNTSQEELVAIATKFKEELKLTNVKVNVLVDPSILGGFIVKLGDKVYNASIKHKFNELRKELILN